MKIKYSISYEEGKRQLLRISEIEESNFFKRTLLLWNYRKKYYKSDFRKRMVELKENYVAYSDGNGQEIKIEYDKVVNVYKGEKSIYIVSHKGNIWIPIKAFSAMVEEDNFLIELIENLKNKGNDLKPSKGVYLGKSHGEYEDIKDEFINFEMTKKDYIKINAKLYNKINTKKKRYFHITTTFMIIFFLNNLLRNVHIESYIFKAAGYVEILIYALAMLGTYLFNEFESGKVRRNLEKLIKDDKVTFDFLVTSEGVLYRLDGLLVKYKFESIEGFSVKRDFLVLYFKTNTIVIPLGIFKNKTEVFNYLLSVYKIAKSNNAIRSLEKSIEKNKSQRKVFTTLNIVLLIFSLFFIVEAQSIHKEASSNRELQNQELPTNIDSNVNYKYNNRPINNNGDTTAANIDNAVNGIRATEENPSLDPYKVGEFESSNIFESNYDYSTLNVSAKNNLKKYMKKIEENKGDPLNNLNWSKEQGMAFFNNPKNGTDLNNKFSNYPEYFMEASSFGSCVSFYEKNPEDTLSDCNNSIEASAAYLSQIGNNSNLYTPLLKSLKAMEALNDLAKSSNEGCNDVIKLQEEMSYVSTMNYLNKSYKNLGEYDIGQIQVGNNNVLFRDILFEEGSTVKLYKLYENGDFEYIGEHKA